MRLASQQPTVDDDIQDHDNRAEHDLHRGRQPGRVDQWKKIARNEIALIRRIAGQALKMFFQWRKRARQAEKLRQRTPERGGNMQPGHLRPLQYQQAAQQHENDERKMRQQSEVGQQAVKGLFRPRQGKWPKSGRNTPPRELLRK